MNIIPEPISCQESSQQPVNGIPLTAQRPRERHCQGEREERSDSLLYLYSNNTTENLSSYLLFSPYHKKQAEVIYQNVARFISQIGIEKVGFLTLTFPDNVKCHKEAYRRFNIMRAKLLNVLFGSEWLCVKELQVRGAWHFHILVNCLQDVRTGLNWDEIHPPKGKRPKYTSASPFLRSLWKELRENLPKYKFGRSELLPIRSTAEGCGRYMGKYLSKHNLSKVMTREPSKYKGVRLFSSSKGFPTSTPKFSWNTEGGKEWRRKLAKFCDLVGIKNHSYIHLVFGEKWAYSLLEYITQVDTLTPPEIYRIASIYQLKHEKSKLLTNAARNSKFRKAPEVVGDELINLATGEVLF